MKWSRDLQSDPLPWLLEPENPSVRYWTLRDLLDRPADDPEVQAARAAIPTYPPVAELLAAQNPDGYWIKRDYYLPKHHGTFWTLSVLADLGLVHKVMPIVDRDRVDTHSLTPVDKFSTQQTAMTIGGVADRGGDIIPWGFRWGAVTLPRDQAAGTWVWSRGYYVTARTNHPQQAWALVRYLSESENESTQLVPARRSVARTCRRRSGS